MAIRTENVTRTEPLIPVLDRELAIRNLTSLASELGLIAAYQSLPSEVFGNELHQLLATTALGVALICVAGSEMAKRQKAIHQMAKEEHFPFPIRMITTLPLDAWRIGLESAGGFFNDANIYFNGRIGWEELFNKARIYTRLFRARELMNTLNETRAVIAVGVEASNVCVVAKRSFSRLREAYQIFRTAPGKAFARGAVSLFNLAAEGIHMWEKVTRASYVLSSSLFTYADLRKSTNEFISDRERERLEAWVEAEARPIATGEDWQAIEKLGLSLGEVRPEILVPQPLNRL